MEFDQIEFYYKPLHLIFPLQLIYQQQRTLVPIQYLLQHLLHPFLLVISSILLLLCQLHVLTVSMEFFDRELHLSTTQTHLEYKEPFQTQMVLTWCPKQQKLQLYEFVSIHRLGKKSHQFLIETVCHLPNQLSLLF